MSTTTTMRWNEPELAAIKKRAMQGLILTGQDIANKARRKAPVLTGALQKSIRVSPNSASFSCEVIAGGNIGGAVIKYAYVREKFNKKHPNTRFYMSNSLKEVMNGNWQKNFKGVSS